MIALIVGLGNPGDRYLKTRHNAGFWLLDALAAHHQASFSLEKKFFAEMSSVMIGTQKVRLAKPQTFMNESGRAVGAIARFYDIAPEEILVVHDEMDLPEGTAKLKHGGGHGGHNGLRDIINVLGSRDFYRLRIGIDHPADKQVVDYVLGTPSKAKQALIDDALTRGERAIDMLVTDGAEKAMNWLHTK